MEPDYDAVSKESPAGARHLLMPAAPDRVFDVVPIEAQDEAVKGVRSAMRRVGEASLRGTNLAELPISLDLRVRLQAARAAGYVLPNGVFTAANGTYGVTFPAEIRNGRRIEFGAVTGVAVEEARGLFRKRKRRGAPAAVAPRGVHQFSYEDRDELATALASPWRLPMSDPGAGELYYRITVVASNLVAELQASRAWNSEYFDVAHAKFSPSAELEEVTRHAQHLARLQDAIGTTCDGVSDEAALARKHQDFQRQQLEVLTESLIRRVGALHHYVGLVTDLSEKVVALEQLEQATRIDRELEEAFLQYGRDELARQRYRELETDLAGVRASVGYLLATLTGEPGLAPPGR